MNRETAIPRRSLHDELVERLRRQIVEGELAPGEKISEKDLCAAYDVSRTPLREALKVLAREGLVVLTPHRGAHVSMLTVADVEEAFPVIGALEGLAGELACAQATDEEIAKISLLHMKMATAHKNRDRQKYFRLNQQIHEALAEAARTVGSPQIRARGTIGGNLGTASPAGDSLPFLVAAGADVLAASREGSRHVPMADFLVGPKRNALRPGELILGVDLPDDVPETQAFSKIGVRQAMTIAMANVCVLRGPDGETTVALGAVGPTILRATDAEVLASEAKADEAMLVEFQRLASQAARPITDHRGTAEYRRHAVGVIARRALERTLAA